MASGLEQLSVNGGIVPYWFVYPRVLLAVAAGGPGGWRVGGGVDGMATPHERRGHA